MVSGLSQIKLFWLIEGKIDSFKKYLRLFSGSSINIWRIFLIFQEYFKTIIWILKKYFKTISRFGFKLTEAFTQLKLVFWVLAELNLADYRTRNLLKDCSYATDPKPKSKKAIRNAT